MKIRAYLNLYLFISDVHWLTNASLPEVRTSHHYSVIRGYEQDVSQDILYFYPVVSGDQVNLTGFHGERVYKATPEAGQTKMVC